MWDIDPEVIGGERERERERDKLGLRAMYSIGRESSGSQQEDYRIRVVQERVCGSP